MLRSQLESYAFSQPRRK